MLPEWILQEIISRCIHFFTVFCTAHIDVIGVFGLSSGRKVLFVQTFSTTFNDSEISGRQQSLNTDTAFRFKMAADVLTFGLLHSDCAMCQYYFVAPGVNH